MMNKLKIKETIIVEGKHDMAKIKSLVDANVLVTNGTHVSKDFIQLAKQLAKLDGIIIFTDPDTPGKQIRNKLIEHLPDAKHAILTQKQTKVGVEHANDEMILNALEHAVVWKNHLSSSLTREEFNALGLSGQQESQRKRDALSKHYRLPRSNAKQLFKLLNMLQVKKEEIEAIV